MTLWAVILTHGKIFYHDPNQLPMYLPSPDLLRDHFHQCVLCHVKGTGESDDQRSFDPDLDLGAGGFNLESGGWWSGAEGKKQLEAELVGHLHHMPKELSID
jgi:hypothetical protein